MNKNILFSAMLTTSKGPAKPNQTKLGQDNCDPIISQLRIKFPYKLYRTYRFSAIGGSSTQTHFRPNAAGKKPFKTKKKKIVTRRAPLGHFRWAPFFLYCQQIKSFRPTARTPAFIPFILFMRSLFAKIRCFC